MKYIGLFMIITVEVVTKRGIWHGMKFSTGQGFRIQKMMPSVLIPLSHAIGLWIHKVWDIDIVSVM